MIQFNETFWVGTAFVIFIALIYKTLKKFIINSLDKKIESVKHDIDKAKELKLEAEHILIEFIKREKQFTKSADEIIFNAKSQKNILEKESKDKISNEIEYKLVKAKESFEIEKERFFRHISQNILDNAFKIVEVIIANEKGGFIQKFNQEALESFEKNNPLENKE